MLITSTDLWYTRLFKLSDRSYMLLYRQIAKLFNESYAQPSVIITGFNIICWIHHCSHWGRRYNQGVHTGHIISCPHGRTMGCLLWLFVKKIICILKALYCNKLWLRDAIWRHRSGSTLAQTMACYLTIPSHYLHKCWLIIKPVLWHSPVIDFTRSIHEPYP